MKQIKELLIISPSFPKNEENEIVVPPLHLYLRSLKKRYPLLNITVLTIHYPFQKEEYNCFGIRVIPFGGANGSIAKRPTIWVKMLKRIKQLHIESPIDLIHSFWLSESALVANYFSKKNKVKHICTMMGQDVLKSNRYLKLFSIHNMNLVALSEFQKGFLEGKSKKSEIKVIPWGVVDSMVTLSESRPIDLICVSSLIPLKRVELFIDLVSEIVTSIPNLKAEIIGDGTLREVLRQKVRLLSLENNITFRGEMPRNECLERMNNSKILVHTSSYESQGYVLNEALQQGCNVITFTKGLMIDSNRFYIIDDKSQLKGIVLEILNSEFTSKSEVSIKMEQTIDSYSALLSSLKLTF